MEPTYVSNDVRETSPDGSIPHSPLTLTRTGVPIQQRFRRPHFGIALEILVPREAKSGATISVSTRSSNAMQKSWYESAGKSSLELRKLPAVSYVPGPEPPSSPQRAFRVVQLERCHAHTPCYTHSQRMRPAVVKADVECYN